jgi:hypothetical protein
MKTFTLHLPVDAHAGDRDALENAALVKDGFSFWAFVFTFLWFFWHRLWLAGLLVLVGVVGFGYALAALDVQPFAAGLAELLLAILVGLEANALRRWNYERNGRPVADVITAASREEAEAKAVVRAVGPSGTGPAAPVPPLPPRLYGGPEPVIGLFPDPERGR